MYKEYSANKNVFERVKLLCEQVFGKCLVELHELQYTDPSVSINGRVEIFWSEDIKLPKRSILGSTLVPGYMVGIIHTIPATRESPMDADIEEVGVFADLNEAVKKAIELEAVFRVNDYLDYEADMSCL